MRADATAPSPAAHERAVPHTAGQAATDDEALVLDAGFAIRRLQEAGATAYGVRAAKNVTARRAVLPDAPGRGRPRTRGLLVRPLARTYRDRRLAASPPDQVTTWQEGDAALRAEQWDTLVLPDAASGAPSGRIVVVPAPSWTEPLVLATTLAVSARALRDLYLDRWPVEPRPLAAKQLPAPPARSFPRPKPASACRSWRCWPARS